MGPRLRRVRKERGVTLTDLAERTGISKSTLSRLENGQRRPSLELLLPLAQAYGVPLDDLVGAPEVGDPRIRLKPRSVNGRTVLPLTRQPNGVQAWKIVIPARQSTPQPRTHDGYEWLYVLSGRMRLVLGDRDLVLEVGRGRRVRHPAAALVRQHRRGTGRGAEHLRPSRRAHARARPLPARGACGVTTAPLLQTKLYAPRVTRELVDRPRLSDRLDARPAVLLVSAPAGFGKSTLLAQSLLGTLRQGTSSGRVAVPGLRRQRPVVVLGVRARRPPYGGARAWVRPRRPCWSRPAAHRSPPC